MARRSKKSKKRATSSSQSQQYSSSAKVARYFLAGVGVFLLIVALLAILGHFKII